MKKKKEPLDTKFLIAKKTKLEINGKTRSTLAFVLLEDEEYYEWEYSGGKDKLDIGKSDWDWGDDS